MSPLASLSSGFSAQSQSFATSNGSGALSGSRSIGLIVGIVAVLFVAIIAVVVVVRVIVSRQKTSGSNHSGSDGGPPTVDFVSQTYSDTVTVTPTESFTRDSGELMRSFPKTTFSIDTPLVSLY
jgi:hypothetical protein